MRRRRTDKSALSEILEARIFITVNVEFRFVAAFFFKGFEIRLSFLFGNFRLFGHSHFGVIFAFRYVYGSHE